MSRVDELIAEHCPVGVEFKTLDEFGTLYNGLTGKSKADFTDGNARFVTYVNILNNLATNVCPDDLVHVVPGERQNRVQYGDVLFTASSEGVDEVGMASGVTAEPPEPLYLNSFCFGFRPSEPGTLDPEFAKHLFRSEQVRRQIMRTANGVTRINISKQRFRDVKVALPPLAIQREIAVILDNMNWLMTELEAELEAELQYRSQQYAHYRESLLAVADGGSTRWARLDELFGMRAGRFVAAADIAEAPDAEHPYPCFGGGGLRGYVGKATHEGERALVGRQGALCGNVKRTSGKFYATEHAVVVTPRPEVDIRWGYHMLTAMNLNQYATKSAQPGLAVGTLERLRVPVPRHPEQQLIGIILDKFEALVRDLSLGLPAEIRARRQQYEFYRDRLLRFEERAA